MYYPISQADARPTKALDFHGERWTPLTQHSRITGRRYTDQQGGFLMAVEDFHDNLLFEVEVEGNDLAHALRVTESRYVEWVSGPNGDD